MSLHAAGLALDTVRRSCGGQPQRTDAEQNTIVFPHIALHPMNRHKKRSTYVRQKLSGGSVYNS